MSLDDARKIADSVLYEGYLLYPYRSSHPKNLTRVRWQFGVLVPEAQSESEPAGCATPTVSGAGETWYSTTGCIVDQKDPDAVVDVRLRFLRLQSRVVPEDAGGPGNGDEGTETEIDHRFSLSELTAGERVIPLELDATSETDGEVQRHRQALSLRLRASASALPGPYGIVQLRLRVENVTGWTKTGAGRDEVLAHSPIATHLLIGLTGGRFVSMVDPPEWAKPAVAGCTNEHTWPVLVGSTAQDTMLSAPMVLPDFPEVAPESPTDLFDSLENDELLSLRIMTLTDEEKAEARATDPRAASIIDSVDNLPPELYQRLHGAIRSLEAFPEIVTDDTGKVRKSTVPPEEGVPWWDPAADASVNPDTDSVPVNGVDVARGSRVVLRPGAARSDAQDMFLVGREATVAAVLFDIDDEPYLAVVLDDDPAAAEIMRWHGRYLYFKPHEVEPVS